MIPNEGSPFSDEAALNLASLKFSQSNRGPDPRDPTRIVTTTTTTTFSMTRDMAKAMAQHFMDARLIENAADRSSNLFKERGVYMLTPKGLHVLERFISKNGMSADHLLHVFASQPICMKLLHLERRTSDDEIIISQSVITALFRRFAGRQPNYPLTEVQQPQDPGIEYHERSKGIPLIDVQERISNTGAKLQLAVHKHCFTAVSALEWLCDFTSIVGRDEAAEMAAHFVRFGLIALVSDKRKGTDSAVIFTVRGTTGNSAAAAVSFCPVTFWVSLFVCLYGTDSPFLFFSLSRKLVNFAAQPKRFIVSRKRVDALLDGTSQAVPVLQGRIRPTPRVPMSLRPRDPRLSIRMRRLKCLSGQVN